MRASAFHYLILFTALQMGCSIVRPSNSRDAMSKLEAMHEELRGFIKRGDAAKEDVSRWSVYQHAEHVLKANRGIISYIESQSEPEEIQSRSLLGYLSLGLGYIPRGQAKSPEAVLPLGKDKETLGSLEREVDAAFKSISADTMRSKKVVANHPYFGGLNSHEWIRFMEVHTRHHLKIMREILASA